MQPHYFALSGEYIQLNKLLKFVGVSESGGASKALVASGVVTVDGEMELRKTAKIRAGQVVSAGGVAIHVHGPAIAEGVSSVPPT